MFGLTSQCFTGDTLVSTETGLCPMAEIQIGDYVWSEDTETGKKELKQVTDVSVTMTNVLVYVTTENGTTIKTTENHPFYVEGKGWCAAAELETGDICRTKDGQTEIVVSVVIEEQDELVKVYNLTIEDNHTYYVSNKEILVHNKCLKNADGTVDIDDWSEYLEELIHPEGPFIVLEGDAYATARNQANNSNRKLHRMYQYLKGLQIHETLPVKFGGNPVDIDNKVALTPKQHAQFTVFWNRILKELGDMVDE